MQASHCCTGKCPTISLGARKLHPLLFNPCYDWVMKTSRERILLVENDPEICDLVARQTLQAMGYQVQVARLASIAIQEAPRYSPDIIITDLQLPDLSGKDLLVALNAQANTAPVIIIAQKGMEEAMVQAFRLGATDFLFSPMREAEIVSAVERVLRQIRSKRERDTLGRQLKQTNDELQRRVRELTTIFAIGKAVTSITNQRQLLEKIVEGAVYVSEADCGWLLLREERRKDFKLAAQRNLPKTIAEKVDQPWDDGISSLVALSGETLSIFGEPLTRFKVSQLGQSALVVPIKLKKEVVGLLVVVRKMREAFSPSNRTLLEAVSDYASISLVNSGLFRALEDRARSLQQAAQAAQESERKKDLIIQSLRDDLTPPLAEAMKSLNTLLVGEKARLNSTQKGVLRSSLDKLQAASATVETLAPQE